MEYGAVRAICNVGLMTFALSSAVLAEEVTVAALGDSLTQGYGLPADKGFVPQLQRWLRQEGAEVAVINAGVSGDTTAGGLSRIAWTLTDDVDAVIVALGGNDMLRGLDPGAARANLDGMLAYAAEKGVPVLLIGLEAPANYGPDYKAAFDVMYADLAATYGAEHHPNFLGALAALNDRDKALRLYMQSDGIHPNAAGVALIVKDIGPSVLGLIDRVR